MCNRRRTPCVRHIATMRRGNSTCARANSGPYGDPCDPCRTPIRLITASLSRIKLAQTPHRRAHRIRRHQSSATGSDGAPAHAAASAPLPASRARSSRATMWRPINPAPPMTRMLECCMPRILLSRARADCETVAYTSGALRAARCCPPLSEQSFPGAVFNDGAALLSNNAA